MRPRWPNRRIRYLPSPGVLKLKTKPLLFGPNPHRQLLPLVTRLSYTCHFFSAALSELSIGGKVSGHGHPRLESWHAEALLPQERNPLWTADGMAGSSHYCVAELEWSVEPPI